MNLIDNLNWRYATKAFDPAKKVSSEELEVLKEAVRLSPSAYGLQLYKVLIVENKEIRMALREASWNQPQITDASHLFIFCNFTQDFNDHVDDYVQLIVEAQGVDKKQISPYGEFIKSQLNNNGTKQNQIWAEKQTYLALSNLLAACAELKIDACPMEGFLNDAYNKILGLNKQGLNASVIATVGYRSDNDEAQFRKKVRKDKEQLFELVY
ncbi:NAD(P)H-dependent oxidoreductase [uncultured Roseivirga sp.]|uniref:NAD(P)H-dependent oxidoreductase n=1 Tax=uncultured Roseivirga sp. TaxID=543088 RepID=UPI000D78FE1F|nr:NAD(P)H-dependent oxidoreductase [uncultured Roseivirga sp.]PWL31670.1 MAG: NAD(P)H-dependent oxidoreductase [Roseivirga sp. XM-24bin3]